MKKRKYINQFNPEQKSLFGQDSEQIRAHHLAKLKDLREEFKVKADEWTRKQRLTMLGEKQ